MGSALEGDGPAAVGDVAAHRRAQQHSEGDAEHRRTGDDDDVEPGELVAADEPGDALQDEGLVALDAGHLFEPSTTMIGCRRGTFLRGYMYEFIEIFAPHLDRDVVEQAFEKPNRAEVDELFEGVELPVR